MKKFYVLEPHVNGTHTYQPGDEREGDEHELRHLVDLKVLSTEKPNPAKSSPDAKGKTDGGSEQAKSEGGADQNKAQGGADQNKSA